MKLLRLDKRFEAESLAQDDLWVFFSNLGAFKQIAAELERTRLDAYKELREKVLPKYQKKTDALPIPIPACTTYREFAVVLLRTYERLVRLGEPTPIPKEFGHIRQFLLGIKNWLNMICIPCDGNANRPVFGAAAVAELGQMVLTQSDSFQAKLSSCTRGDDKDLGGFYSWLVLDYKDGKDPVFHIIYDRTRIERGLSNVPRSDCTDTMVESLLEDVFLHEIGHARLHGMDYLSAHQYRCSPFQEAEAWTYASALRSLVRSTRVLVTRLLDDTDRELPAFEGLGLG